MVVFNAKKKGKAFFPWICFWNEFFPIKYCGNCVKIISIIKNDMTLKLLSINRTNKAGWMDKLSVWNIYLLREV